MISTTKLARTRALRAWSAGAVLVAAAACSDRSKSADTDSSLARDLALAGTQTQQPTFQDTAIAPAPTPTPTGRAHRETPAPVRARTQAPRREAPRVAQRPAPHPSVSPMPAPTPVSQGPAATVAHGEIGAGTGFALTSGSKVCTNTNLPGDKLVATVNESVTGANGAVIPAGSNVVLEVASVNPGDNGQAAQITFRVRAVVVNDRTYDAAGNVEPLAPLDRAKVANVDPNADKKKVIGGAIAGAILGQMIGHNTKGTVIGAAAGAAAGAAVAKSGEKWEACLPAGAPMRITLSQPIVMS